MNFETQSDEHLMGKSYGVCMWISLTNTVKMAPKNTTQWL